MTVTKAERSILNLLWKRSPRTLGEIISEIREEHNWSEHTITILLSRLMRKGAIVTEEAQGETEYASAISAEELGRSQQPSFWARMMDHEAFLLVNTKKPVGAGHRKGRMNS